MKKYKYYIFLLTILMFVLNGIIYIRFIKYPNGVSQTLGADLALATGDIVINNMIEQEFVAEGNCLNNIEIFFSTYNRRNRGQTKIAVLCKDAEIIEKTIDNESVLDNAYKKIEVNDGDLQKGEKYLLRISSEIEGEGITAWRDNKGELVAKLEYTDPLTGRKYLLINLVYLLFNSLFCGVIWWLRN